MAFVAGKIVSKIATNNSRRLVQIKHSATLKYNNKNTGLFDD